MACRRLELEFGSRNRSFVTDRNGGESGHRQQWPNFAMRRA
jgi:hypothetical protein